jgi:D-glycero-D-manno-heptose 1,7-bisphosphate phosphatase
MTNKILFLDRDGVVNMEVGNYVYQHEQFEFVPGLFQFLKNAVELGYVTILITNQGGISKGLYGHREVEALNQMIRTEFEKNGIPLLEIYYSPYHPDQTLSLSRKPDSIMLEKALSRFGTLPENCVMIGDRERDMEAAARVGVKGILVDSNTDLFKAGIHDQL